MQLVVKRGTVNGALLRWTRAPTWSWQMAGQRGWRVPRGVTTSTHTPLPRIPTYEPSYTWRSLRNIVLVLAPSQTQLFIGGAPMFVQLARGQSQDLQLLYLCVCVCVRASARLSLQSCPTLFDSLDCSPPGSSVHGISQAIILEYIAIFSSRGSPWPKKWTCISCISRQILYHCATYLQLVG